MAKGSGGTRNGHGYSSLRNITENYLLRYAQSRNSGFDGMKSISFEDLDNTNVLADISMGELRINTNVNLYLEGKKLNMERAVTGAISNIQGGKELTFEQEFALKTIWHEAIHTQSPWQKGVKGATKSQQMTMETVNEFISAMTYQNFIARLGGEAKHEDRIMKHLAYGTSDFVNKMRASKIKLNVAADALQIIHNNTSNPTTYKAKVISTLESLGMKDARKWWNKNI